MLENLPSHKQERATASLLTLSNASELGLQVLRSVMGDEISTTIGDSPLTNEQIGMMMSNQIREKIALRPVERHNQGSM